MLFKLAVTPTSCFFKLLIIDLFLLFILYWSIVDLQCCDSFSYMAKWFSYTTQGNVFACSVISNSLWPHGAPLSMRFPRPQYWNGLPFPSVGYLPDPGIEPEADHWDTREACSVILIHRSILFQILLPFRLLRNTEQISLWSTVGPCWLSILSIAGYTCRFPTPKLSPPHPSPGNHSYPLVTISSFSKSVGLFLLCWCYFILFWSLI